MEDINVYKYWMHCLPKIGDVAIYKLLALYDNAYEVYKAINKKDKRLNRVLSKDQINEVFNINESIDIFDKYKLMTENKIRFITIDDEIYPKRLRSIENPPYAIYVKGELPEDDVPSVAIIGARNCSEYGTFIANSFGETLASMGINIISGMARGIDGISQRGAINKNGKTYAVLGCGVDVCYPMGNYKLYKDILNNGGIISIFPPGEAPIKKHFPERNRIVAALSDLILVVEARQKSGTSITVDMAMKMGKDVYAVPGRLTDRLSDGCNILIRDGAGIVLSPEDVLRELSIIWGQKYPQSDYINIKDIKNINKYTKEEDLGVLKYLDFNPLSIDDIQKLRNQYEPEVSLSQTLSELILLCSEGKVVQTGSCYFNKSGSVL